MPAVRVDRVSKTYDHVTNVLDEVTLSVDPGEVVVLMGRSGSGKTTLLNLIAGLDEPTQGRVLVDGTDLAELDEEALTRLRRDQVGIVFQRFHLIPELSVVENVELPMKLAGRKDARERAERVLGFFGVDHRASAFPATLSGGETQRAAMARALVNHPVVLLADEPTANLDEDNALRALEALQRVAQRLGTAVLVATHDPLARDAGDRVLHLKDGRIVQRETPGAEGEEEEGLRPSLEPPAPGEPRPGPS